MLYLVATPIGNLGDISFRAVEALRSCDYILCEDTRHSRKLLKVYDIVKPLRSYHKFNEAKKLDGIIDGLKKGLNIALITDAGTPNISDPGGRLVRQCIASHLPVSAIPGPCAAIVALTLSGFDSSRFQFIGFLPRKKGRLRSILNEIFSFPGTTICYESAKRLPSVLEEVKELFPERQLCVAREMTKKFEEIVWGTSGKLRDYWKNHVLKGEVVLLIEKSLDINDQTD